MIYVLAGTLAYALFITTLYVLMANEVEELGKSLKEARRENKWLREHVLGRSAPGPAKADRPEGTNERNHLT